MLIIIIFFLIIIIHSYFATRYLLSGISVFRLSDSEDSQIEDYNGRNLLAPVILASALLLLFVAALLSLRTGFEDYTIFVFFTGLGLLPVPTYLNSKQFVRGVEGTLANRNQYKAIVAAVILALIGLSSYLIWDSQQLPDAPFIYYPDSIVVEDEYCIGDPLVITFDGMSDGSGRIVKVVGQLELTGDDDRDYVVAEHSFTNDNIAISEPVEFNDFIFDSWALPRNLTPGVYEWHHQNFAVDLSGNQVSKSSHFVTPQFEIVDCGN